MSTMLVTYFTASGTTRTVAEHLAKAAGADIAELVPAQPYTPADLNWNDPNSRCTREHKDVSIRPQIANAPDVSGYDVVFVGYPLWWEQAPNIIRTFLEGQDFSGKTVVTFATSSMSTKPSPAARTARICTDAARWRRTGRPAGA